MAVKLHYDDGGYPLWAERIRRSFGGNAVEIPALEKSNCIVFASRGAPLSPRRIKLQTSLARLSSDARAELKPEFACMVWAMKDLAGWPEWLTRGLHFSFSVCYLLHSR